MKLRSALMLLAAGSLLPLCIFAVVAVLLLVDHERATRQRESMGRVVSAMSAVDAELRGSITLLQALGASRNLQTADLEAFHAEAARVLATQSYWLNIGLATPAREKLLDAILPFGAHAPFGDDSGFDLAVKSGKAVVGDVGSGAAVGKPSVRIRLPIVTDGSLRYILTATLDPAMFRDLLAAQQIPDDWVIGLVDRQRRFVARIPDPPAARLASADFRAALDRSPEGWFRGRTVEGSDTFTPYVTSPSSGWSLGIAIPVSAIDAVAWRTLWIAVGGMLFALACAMGLGWLLARRIAAPIASLARAAQAMGRGDEVGLREAGRVAEVRQLHDALQSASVAIRDRQHLAQSEKAALEREQHALQSADKAKSEFIATLSHELRNPLSAMVAAAQVLKDIPTDNTLAVQARDILERQLKQMVRLIEDLLDISRIAAGKANLNPEVFDLSELVRQLVDAWTAGGKFSAHAVELRSEPVSMRADRARMEQVLTNLLDNALKYTPAGGSIRVTTAREKGQAVLTVADDGEGIDASDLGRIFDLFEQAGQDHARPGTGLGIGLAIVKRLVELQDGTIDASSPGLGRGSTFVVRMRAAEPLHRAVPEVETVAPVLPAPLSRRILLIDDNEDGRRMMHAILALNGHDVHDCPDGLSGVALAGRIKPEVAFVDIGLPDIDGYEVARRLRAEPFGKDAMLIAVSGYGQDEDRRRAIEAGFDLHLAKPVSIEALEQSIVAVARSRSVTARSDRVA